MNKFILDPTCGCRSIWFNKKHPSVLYADIRKEEIGFCPERPNYEVNPDEIIDFKDIPYKDKHFKLIVWDPPHLDNLGRKSRLGRKYGCLIPETWQSDIKTGFKELWRVLDINGILILKWNESCYSLKEVLSLFPIDPLFGHTTGSKSKTKWVTFMKIPKEMEGE